MFKVPLHSHLLRLERKTVFEMLNSIVHAQFIVVILLGVFWGAIAHRPWTTYTRRWSPRYHYHRVDYVQPHQGHYQPSMEKRRYGRPCAGHGHVDQDYYNQNAGLGCSCLLYVEYSVVFQRIKNDVMFPCNSFGLQSCAAYCDNLFQNEGLRASSEQEACDVLGRELDVSWYRKDQVCGSNGPYKDTPLQKNLCCKRGRSAVTCGQ